MSLTRSRASRATRRISQSRTARSSTRSVPVGKGHRCQGQDRHGRRRGDPRPHRRAQGQPRPHLPARGQALQLHAHEGHGADGRRGLDPDHVQDRLRVCQDGLHHRNGSRHAPALLPPRARGDPRHPHHRRGRIPGLREQLVRPRVPEEPGDREHRSLHRLAPPRHEGLCSQGRQPRRHRSMGMGTELSLGQRPGPVLRHHSRRDRQGPYRGKRVPRPPALDAHPPEQPREPRVLRDHARHPEACRRQEGEEQVRPRIRHAPHPHPVPLLQGNQLGRLRVQGQGSHGLRQQEQEHHHRYR